MARKVKTVLRTCHSCQTAKHPNQHTYVEMGNIVIHGKNELLCIDFLGPLPRVARGMRNLVVCTDAFTKNVNLYAVGRPTTDAVPVSYTHLDVYKRQLLRQPQTKFKK